MGWTEVIVLGSFCFAGLLAIYQWRTEDWNTGQQIGTGLFFLGAVIGLFLDELLGSSALVLPWAEPIGAVIMLFGLAISFRSRSS